MSIHQLVATALTLAQQGVTYTPKGAFCPVCGKKMCITGTKKEGSTRIRWHKCKNEECLLASMALLVKSVECKNVA